MTQASIVSARLCNILSKEASEILMTLPTSQLSIIRVTGKQNNNVKIQKLLHRNIGQIELPMFFLVVEGISVDLLIGCDILRLYQTNIDLKYNKIMFIKDVITYTVNLMSPSVMTIYAMMKY